MPRPLRILSPIHRATRQVALAMEERLGGASSQGHLLSYLRSYAPCSIGEVGRVFGLKGSTLTGMLDRMERAQLLRREVDPDDRRSFLVHLSAEGTRRAEKANKAVRALERGILARVTERDLAGFDRVLAAIAAESHIDVRPRKTPR